MPSYKLDATLAEAVDLAKAALSEITQDEQIGEHLGAAAEGDRLVAHRFTAHRPGYQGWEWFVTVARAPRSKKVTVCEVGLLPGDNALLAPEWVPWADRVTEDEKATAEA